MSQEIPQKSAETEDNVYGTAAQPSGVHEVVDEVSAKPHGGVKVVAEGTRD